MSRSNNRKLIVCISTHASAGGAPLRATVPALTGPDFYSHPCEKGDIAINQRYGQTSGISTRAPVEGAISIYCG